VLVDVAIDQGGCFETSVPTTHSDPTYEVVLSLAANGVAGAVSRDPGLLPGINVAAGRVTHAGVAEGVGTDFTPPTEALDLTMSGV
jgi:alanine dehydrogenase